MKIGLFSILSNISIPRLRDYDRLGILQPNSVDNNTGYRRYAKEQLLIANKIESYRQLGLSLAEINTIINKSNIDFKALIESHISKNSSLIKELESKNSKLTQVLSKESTSVFPDLCDFKVKKIPKMEVVYLRRVIKTYSHEGELWKELLKDRSMGEVVFGAIFHDKEFQEKDIDVEVFMGLSESKKIFSEKDRIKIFRETTVVSYVFKGQYSQLYPIHSALLDWTEKNNYIISGDRFNLYHISPNTESKAENLITEVCFPIKTTSSLDSHIA